MSRDEQILKNRIKVLMLGIDSTLDCISELVEEILTYDVHDAVVECITALDEICGIMREIQLIANVVDPDIDFSSLADNDI